MKRTFRKFFALCIQAGADIVLCSKDFIRAFNTIVKCVEDGAITEERINQSVRRKLKLKKQLSSRKNFLDFV